MSYLRARRGLAHGLGFDLFQSFESPWQGAPGPVPPPPGGTVAGPTMPAQLFPTSNLKWGDVVNVTGNFSGMHQGNIRVKFTGAPWQAPVVQGPFSASVRVPEGAKTGECAIEVNGRRVFGTQCVVTGPAGSAPARGPYGEAWKNFGPKSGDLSGTENSMSSYVIQKQSRGVGAIAAADLGLGAAREDAPRVGDPPVPDPVRNYNKPPRGTGPRRVGPVLVFTRPVRGVPPKVFTPGKTGRQLQVPRKVITKTPKRPAPPSPPGTSPVTGTMTPQALEEPSKFVSYPPVTYPSGLMPGEPEYADEFAEDEIITTASPAPKKANKALIIGGLAASALFAYWLMTRGE